MTRLLVDPATDFDDPSPVTLTATLLDPGPAIVRTFEGVTAATVVDLPAPGTAEAWRLTIRRPTTTMTRWGTVSTDPGPIVEERTVHFAGAGPVAWAALTDIDPATLQATAVPSAAWDAAISELRAEVDALPTGGGGTGGADLSGYAPLASPAFTGTPTIGGVAVAKVTDVGSSGGGAVVTDLGFDVIILAGQSNMAGSNATGSSSADPSHYDPSDGRVFVYNWVGSFPGVSLAVEPVFSSREPGAGIGPGLGFARWYAGLAPTNRKVLLVPAAVSGTGLYAAASPTWHPTVRGSLFDQMVTATQGALAAAGPNARVAAMLWCQGETDGQNGRTTSQYTADLLAFIDSVRTALQLPNLPFSVLGMTPGFIGSTAYPAQAGIDTAHRAIPAARRYTSFTPGVAGMDDAIHYSAAAQRINGPALARGYATQALTNTTAPGSPYPYDYGQNATPALTNTTVPTITGTASTGNVLTASTGTWSATPDSYAYQWRRAGTAIIGATASTYTLTTTDVGQAITATVTATKAGYASGSANSTAVTPTAPAADTTAPTVPTGLTATAGNGQVALAWTASTDAGGVAGYRVWRNGTLAASPTVTSYIDSSLTNGTAYSYTVSAVDAAGNESAQTSAVSATPAAGSSAPSGAIAYDTFTRADASSLGTTELGSCPWSAGTGWAISGNAARFAGASDTPAMVNPGRADNWELRYTVKALTGAYPLAFIWGTSAAISASSRCFRANGAGQWNLIDPTNATIYSQASPDPVAGDQLVLRKQGTAIKLFSNGTQVGNWSWNFSNSAADTWLGFLGAGGSNNPVTLDDFAVVAI